MPQFTILHLRFRNQRAPQRLHNQPMICILICPLLVIWLLILCLLSFCSVGCPSPTWHVMASVSCRLFHLIRSPPSKFCSLDYHPSWDLLTNLATIATATQLNPFFLLQSTYNFKKFYAFLYMYFNTYLIYLDYLAVFKHKYKRECILCLICQWSHVHCLTQHKAK